MADKLPEGKYISKNVKKEDVNTVLRSETGSILSDELKADDATTVLNQTTIVDDSNTDKTGVSDSQWLKEYITKLLAESSPIIFEYHKSEIENVNTIINFILSLIKWVSFSTIALVAFFVVCDKDAGAIISLISGGIIDTILGVLTGLFNSTLKSKKSYFDAENDLAKFNKMLLLIQIISDKSKKDSVIIDILRKYFDVKNDKNQND